MEEKEFYKAFEEQLPGSRERIKSRFEVYLPFVMPFKEIYGENCHAIDLGCGCGEWLELMRDNGINASGVDLDDDMLEACSHLNLAAQNKDELTALKELADESQILVSGFHIAEHLPFDVLREIVKESMRVLKPAGLLILETPNAPALLSFILEFDSFISTKVLRLQEPLEQREPLSQVSRLDLYKKGSPNYSIIAQKNAASKMLEVFQVQFAKDYVSETDILMQKHETQIENKIFYAEVKAQSADAKAQNAEIKASFNDVNTSRSWRMSAPSRTLRDWARYLSHKVKLSLKPPFAVLAKVVVRHKWLKITIIAFMNHFPKLKERMEVFYFGYVTPNKNAVQNDVLDNDTDDVGKFIEKIPMTPYALEIYEELRKEIERSKTEEN